MTHKRNKNLVYFAGLILIGVLVLYFFNGPSLHQLDLTGTGYRHYWYWDAYTTQECVEGPFYTVDEINFPVKTHVGDIVDAAKVGVVTHVTTQLIEKFREKGVTVTVISVYPTVQIDSRRTTRQVRDKTEITFFHTMYIDCHATFDTDKPIDDTQTLSLTGTAIYILWLILNSPHIASIILACFVGFSFYIAMTTWVPSLFIHTSTVEYEYYDPVTGKLIRKERRIETGPDWQAYAVIGIVLICLFGVFWLGKTYLQTHTQPHPKPAKTRIFLSRMRA